MISLLMLTAVAAASAEAPPEPKGEPAATVAIDPGRAPLDELGRPQFLGLRPFPLGLPLIPASDREIPAAVGYRLTVTAEPLASGSVQVSGPGGTPLLYPIPVTGIPGPGFFELTLEAASPALMPVAPLTAVYAVFDAVDLGLPTSKLIPPPGITQDELCLAELFCIVQSLLAADLDIEDCSIFSGEGKAKGPGTGFGLTRLRRLRDEVLEPTPAGGYYADLYYDHSPELGQIMVSHPTLLYDLAEANRLWAPTIDSVLDGDGSAPITPALGAIYSEVIGELRAAATPELRAQIDQEDALIQPASFVGRTAGEYWAAVTSARTEGVFRSGFEAPRR
ncbi:MAG: hypothetical protein AAGA23_08775 [Pseudomonadota bacterium]